MSSFTHTLAPAQKLHFMTHGFVKIPQCFTRSQAAGFTVDLWTRLGVEKGDKKTWPKDRERINMPWHKHVSVKEFAPKAWGAICELLGGEERVSVGAEGEEGTMGWSDGFIVNFGKEEYKGTQALNLRSLDNWHNDGDFFVHYLDSPEQALLVIPLWSDIKSKGGGTAICADGTKYIAKHLMEHPEGVTPWMRSLNDPSHVNYEGREFWSEIAWNRSKTRESSFFEATGEVGDVYLLHPLMLHSASKNLLREVRVITNPPVMLKQPFCFDRQDKSEYSLVELKTLKDLGIDVEKEGGLRGWKITGERKGWTSERMKRVDEERKMEVRRVRGIKSEAFL